MGGTVTTGWHPDPFGLHEARYFNADGQPTKLVRDRGRESYDEPPAAAVAMAAPPAAPPAAAPAPLAPSADPDPYPYDDGYLDYPPRRSRIGLMASIICCIAAGATLAGLLAVVIAPRHGRPPAGPSPSATTQAPHVSTAAFARRGRG